MDYAQNTQAKAPAAAAKNRSQELRRAPIQPPTINPKTINYTHNTQSSAPAATANRSQQLSHTHTRTYPHLAPPTIATTAPVLPQLSELQRAEDRVKTLQQGAANAEDQIKALQQGAAKNTADLQQRRCEMAALRQAVGKQARDAVAVQRMVEYLVKGGGQK